MNKTDITKRLKLVLVLLYLVGIAGFSMNWSYNLFVWLTPFNLLLTLAMLLWAHEGWDTKTTLILTSIALIGFVAELIGVQTQWLFGHYWYGPVLGPKLLQTPLLIGINWLVLAYGVYVLLSPLNLGKLMPFAGALIMVLFDFVMEPVAISLNMWQWADEQIPLKNYLDWYLISCLIFAMMYFLKVKLRNKLAVWILLIQFLFFLVLNFILKPI
ncbi:carotenoid biosynthesis protein [Gaoshiqia sediminis]|uniref:Carotenoid biosynthesis protein n=1 Tax=Gaoshiqia sediminis TaxID=2986998 RepID=A0AA41YDB0_9BACT|nr:carotenoid biosynthesis protein [Gaoshiqia sediminis]MCW0483222.1 carotenoid biosynthesis protein [Gaoshiqia sediminis]